MNVEIGNRKQDSHCYFVSEEVELENKTLRHPKIDQFHRFLPLFVYIAMLSVVVASVSMVALAAMEAFLSEVGMVVVMVSRCISFSEVAFPSLADSMNLNRVDVSCLVSRESKMMVKKSLNCSIVVDVVVVVVFVEVM